MRRKSTAISLWTKREGFWDYKCVQYWKRTSNMKYSEKMKDQMPVESNLNG